MKINRPEIHKQLREKLGPLKFETKEITGGLMIIMTTQILDNKLKWEDFYAEVPIYEKDYISDYLIGINISNLLYAYQKSIAKAQGEEALKDLLHQIIKRLNDKIDKYKNELEECRKSKNGEGG